MFDISSLGALVAGLLSFLSPCVLPLVPFYLGYLAGESIHMMAEGEEMPENVRRKAVIGAFAFAAGMLVVFVSLGAAATAIGQALREWFDVLRWVAGAIVVVMGLHFLGVFRIGLLYRSVKAEVNVPATSIFGALLMGMAFAFGWTPCVGPALAPILMMAAGAETAMQGVWYLFVYGLGMTAPFIVAAFFVGPFLRWMRRFRRHLDKVEKAMGILLIVFGVMIATNLVQLLSTWLLNLAPDLWTKVL